MQRDLLKCLVAMIGAFLFAAGAGYSVYSLAALGFVFFYWGLTSR